MAVFLFKRFLRDLLQLFVCFIAAVHAFGSPVAECAKINLQAVFFGKPPVCNASENVVFFQIQIRSAQKASLLILQN